MMVHNVLSVPMMVHKCTLRTYDGPQCTIRTYDGPQCTLRTYDGPQCPLQPHQNLLHFYYVHMHKIDLPWFAWEVFCLLRSHVRFLCCGSDGQQWPIDIRHELYSHTF